MTAAPTLPSWRVTVSFQGKRGPAAGEVVEIPAIMLEVVLVHDSTGSRDLYRARPWVQRDRHGRPTGAPRYMGIHSTLHAGVRFGSRLEPFEEES
jgi:hypothetical protein